MVRADEARIEQVLFNLINNAFNYSKPSDVITVSARCKGKAVRVEVSDTGRGIPPEDLESIWERYYKGDKSEGRKAVGTGLGLAIVRNILEAHKARFGVDSTLGRGTTFWFELDAE
jgi:signal transduction histidine kinase